MKSGCPSPTSQTVSFSAKETRSIAAGLARRLGPGAVIALHGELGSGKTCFVQGLAEGLGCAAAVTSPTFTLLHEYRGGRLPLYHADLYRIQSPEEFLKAGLMDYLEGDGVIAIEWADRIAELLPAATLHVRLAMGAKPDERIIEIRGLAP
ncbi:MAG: tRNA (adenosine(37)-N6)-threonylcarbamoyltransferase complex ATPase subunit type 1 TsaE [Kiritimatiellae bacterium]|nr:tRNA (adenosine(37)-N6)-threonylcarbamoyltransferase complex ATPase subunit type 1 TsaE [Kiritimatiellia bacterium]MDW8457581.1 tRNA (adenosine(37)-N6)-threonylcarbamoyltransferase complex ATPase subunit type 1 TsaE [Verrucomicrobiota bacterium]